MFEGIRKHWAVWRESWRLENRRPKTRRRSYEREFLPAAIEIMETPASPVGRTIMLTIAAFFVAGLVWAYFGEIDIVATAQGKIIPHSRIKAIQPAEMGIVRAIHVREGSVVKEGDLLVSLDPTDSSADRERIIRELTSAKTELAAINALLAEESPGVKAFSPPPNATEEMVRTQQRLIETRESEFHARLDVQKNELAQRRAEYKTIESTIEKLELSTPLIREQVDIRQYLADKGLSSKLLLLEQRERLVASEKEIVTQHSRLKEASAAITAVRRQIEQIKQEYRRDLLVKLAEVEDRVAAGEQELKKAEKRSILQNLVAPVDGVVQQLSVHTIGGIVQPAEAVVVIVPMDERLEVEAMVLNKDIGFVNTEQFAEVKLETFPFTKYGVIDGRVIDVSRDSINDERVGLVYPTRIELFASTMMVEEKIVDLTPGMAATVEIKTGKRKAIEFLLAPLLKYKSESLRER